MKKKKKGEFFMISSFIVIFLMYLFSIAIIKQESLSYRDLEYLEKSEEILFYVNSTMKKIDLTDKNDTYILLLNLQHDLKLISKLNNMEKVKLDYVYDESIGKWNVTLKIDNKYIYIEKSW